MMKNAIDVLMGGFSYWLVGYGLREAVKIKLVYCFYLTATRTLDKVYYCRFILKASLLHSYGKGELSNPFIGFGDFFVDTFGGDVKMGELYASFFFQFSYAATG